MKTLKYILLSCVVLGAVACDDFWWKHRIHPSKNQVSTIR